MKTLIGFSMLLAGVAGSALAGAVVSAPELDASSGAAALALLAGGMLVLRSRRRKS